jgi:hypothetical protein
LIDAEGGFYIQTLTLHKKELSSGAVRISNEVRLHFKMGLQDQDILKQLAKYLGSTVSKRTHPKGIITYYWSSTSFVNTQKVVSYFENFSLQSTKWFHFIKWQKVLSLVKNGSKKTEIGWGNIFKLKEEMNR